MNYLKSETRNWQLILIFGLPTLLLTNYYIMKQFDLQKIAIILAVIFLSGSVFAQKWEPVLTEIWEPVPVNVTPGKGTAPPSDAVVLFDGTNLAKWEKEDGSDAGWNVGNGILTIVPGTGSIQTRQSFGDIQLHIEWRAPFDVVGAGQGHGNSGVILQKRYEIQVLDCYENTTYVNGQTASVYKQYIPLVNACLPTGEWEVYDIIYMAPRFNDNGTLFAPATVTVLHNGILVQNHVEIKGTIEYIGLPRYEKHDLKQPLLLQDHENSVSYRNIWLREL